MPSFLIDENANYIVTEDGDKIIIAATGLFDFIVESEPSARRWLTRPSSPRWEAQPDDNL